MNIGPYLDSVMLTSPFFDGRFLGIETDAQLWCRLFSVENIERVFAERIRQSGPGVDRITVERFQKEIITQAKIINRKCISGTYRFTPYLEELALKGRGSQPRVLSIPTVRDKIVLSIIKDYLHERFGNNTSRHLPNTVAHHVKRQISKDNKAKIIRVDIKSFYDNVDHDILLRKIYSESNFGPFLKLLKRAIETPTLPRNYTIFQRTEAKNLKGVPQGLPISNILAEIYLVDFDSRVRDECELYSRFVDDILIFSRKGRARKMWRLVTEGLSLLSLELNKDKSTKKWQTDNVADGFNFLGYSFSAKGVSVRNASYHRFLNSILGQITKYKAEIPLIKFAEFEKKKEIFIWELNEQITGAISERKRYGWVFFYSEITDLGLLHQIDRITVEALRRIPGFSNLDRRKIKKVVRAFFEAKHSPEGGYIHNYNEYKTVHDKRKYLLFIGRLKVDAGASYTDEQIHAYFEQAKASNLLKLKRDVGTFS